MKKWIKFLAAFGEYKAGEVVELDAPEADMLIKGKLAEAHEKPAEVDDQATKIAEALTKQMNERIEVTVTAVADRLVKELAPKGGKDKRPHVSTHDNADDDPDFGFKSIGEQVRYIRNWCDPSRRDQVSGDEKMKRLIAVSTKAPTTYANEGLGADGGFLLAPNFSNQILQHEFFDESLLSKTDKYTTGSNSLTVPKDETTPWGTSGIQVYWTAEAAQKTQSKPKFGQDNLILHKLAALVPVTDEQLEDSFVGLGQYVTRQASERIFWAVDEAIVNGGGAGKPLGIINSGALVQQAAESAQTAATINLTNIAKMLSRIPMSSIKNLVWLIHPSAFPQIVIMTNGNNSLYVPPGGLSNAGSSIGSLFGIPVIISQHGQAVGTPGDIMLLDLSKYLTLTKGNGIQTAMSMHLYFDYDISTFRFVFRVAGQPWMSAPITSAYGSYTMSPFVDLAVRS